MALPRIVSAGTPRILNSLTVNKFTDIVVETIDVIPLYIMRYVK